MPNLGSRLTGVPIDTRGGVDGDGLVVTDGKYVAEAVLTAEEILALLDEAAAFVLMLGGM